MRKSYKHDEQTIFEAIGFTEKERDEANTLVQTIFDAFRRSNRLSEVVEKTENVVKKASPRVLSYLLSLAFEKNITSEMMLQAFSTLMMSRHEGDQVVQ